MGLSTSEHQCSKQCTPELCNWARFAQQKGLKKTTDPAYTCDLWNNYETYISQLKKNCHINALRFSIERALVEQAEGTFDQDALQHYADMFKYCINNDITPIVCFHHYTDPCWFADKGGFEKAENCPSFATYCATVYKKIMIEVNNDTNVREKLESMTTQGRAPLFATFNAAEGVAFKGYYTQEGPPANPEKKGFGITQQVLHNMCEAHVLAYKEIKKAYQTLNEQYPSLAEPQIGLLKNIVQIDPIPVKYLMVQLSLCNTWGENAQIVKKTLMRLMRRPLGSMCKAVGEDLQNEGMFNFFTNGQFRLNTLGMLSSEHNEDAPKSLDWIGLNHYSDTFVDGFKRVPEEREEYATDNSNYRVSSDTLIRAIKELNDRMVTPIKKKTGKDIKIVVTENGVATQDDRKRNHFYLKTLYALTKAIKDYKLPVRGYLSWTAFNNYEWPKTDGSAKEQSDNRVYGLCSVSDDGKTLTPKKGSDFFCKFAEEVTKS
ncbi:MAG: family 1 glycosylhydrolase [bacterium]|nr:family 1 glycosylhydrolase [bacterium]